jgi:energy-coupling factor transporter ATP-binding protein EcfA2
MVKLKRLKIHKYRNVRPGTELHFDDGYNLVLGKNASGKTTLLSLLSMVCRSVFTEIELEEFILAYELSTSEYTVVAEVSHLRQSEGPEPRLWNDSYTIVLTPDSGAPAVNINSIDHSKIPLMMDWSFIAAALTNLGGALTKLRAELLTQGGCVYRFDESLDSYAAMTGQDSPLKGPATPPPTYFERNDEHGSILLSAGAYIPTAFGNALAAPTKASEEIGLGAAAATLSDPLVVVLGVKQVDIIPQVSERIRRQARKYIRVDGFDLYIVRDDDRIRHPLWSYGQKRLVAFYYYLALNPGIVIADELVNGLHHRWIEACMDAILDRQAFLTSQNPILFDFIPDFESAEQVQSRFVTCRTELADGAEQLIWENLAAGDAAMFFEAYKAEFQSVGEILITRGLW